MLLCKLFSRLLVGVMPYRQRSTAFNKLFDDSLVFELDDGVHEGSVPIVVAGLVQVRLQSIRLRNKFANDCTSRNRRSCAAGIRNPKQWRSLIKRGDVRIGSKEKEVFDNIEMPASAGCTEGGELDLSPDFVEG